MEEVKVAWEILKALGLRKKGFNDDRVPVVRAGERRDASTSPARWRSGSRGYDEVMEIAVMGCAVNGPGEAGDADFGIAGGRDVGFIYAHGEVLRKVPQDELVDELFREIDAWIEGGMVRPDRKTRKHALPVVP